MLRQVAWSGQLFAHDGPAVHTVNSLTHYQYLTNLDKILEYSSQRAFIPARSHPGEVPSRQGPIPARSHPGEVPSRRGPIPASAHPSECSSQRVLIPESAHSGECSSRRVLIPASTHHSVTFTTCKHCKGGIRFSSTPKFSEH